MVSNPYKVLGVENNASVDVCKKAYRKLCAKYHPDNPTGDREKFDEVQSAWKLIESGKFVTFNMPKKRCLKHSSLFKFTVITE